MSERYQREIEEILGDSQELPQGKSLPKERSIARILLAALGRFLGGRGWGLSPGRIMLGSLGLILIAFLFRASMPGLVAPIAWVGLVVFILGYALFFINPSGSYEKRWRGQVIESQPRLRERIVKWIRGG